MDLVSVAFLDYANLCQSIDSSEARTMAFIPGTPEPDTPFGTDAFIYGYVRTNSLPSVSARYRC